MQALLKIFCVGLLLAAVCRVRGMEQALQLTAAEQDFAPGLFIHGADLSGRIRVNGLDFLAGCPQVGPLENAVITDNVGLVKLLIACGIQIKRQSLQNYKSMNTQVLQIISAHQAHSAPESCVFTLTDIQGQIPSTYWGEMKLSSDDILCFRAHGFTLAADCIRGNLTGDTRERDRKMELIKAFTCPLTEKEIERCEEIMREHWNTPSPRELLELRSRGVCAPKWRMTCKCDDYAKKVRAWFADEELSDLEYCEALHLGIDQVRH